MEGVDIPQILHQLNQLNFLTLDTDSTIRVQATPVAGTWYQLAGVNLSITLAAGTYNLYAKIITELFSSTAGDAIIFLSFGTSSTPGTDLIGNLFTGARISTNAPDGYVTTIMTEPSVILASSKTIYINMKYENTNSTPNIVNMWMRGDFHTSICKIWAGKR